MLDHRGDQRARAAHPVSQDRAVDRHAVTGQKRLGRPFAVILEPVADARSPFQQMRGRLGLDHIRASLGTGVLGHTVTIT